MKKTNYILFAIACLLLYFASCNRPMTYAERLRAEERAIAQFLSENSYRILTTFPPDTVFGPNEFFLEPLSGVYFHIVCRGTLFNEKGEMFDEHFNLFTEGRLDTIQLGREIHIRFREMRHFMTDTIIHSNDLAFDPITMVFQGRVNRQTLFLYQEGIPGLIAPLPYIGHNAIVRLIVPFSMGSHWERMNFQPAFYGEVNYRFEQGMPWRSAE